jgi:hypothetical protein
MPRDDLLAYYWTTAERKSADKALAKQTPTLGQPRRKPSPRPAAGRAAMTEPLLRPLRVHCARSSAS